MNMSVLFTRRGKASVLSKKASDYAIGESVFLNENGSPAEYLIVQQGNPDTSMYDASCDGVWLLRKDLYTNMNWYYTTSNDYAASDIHSYLNNDFLTLLDTKVQSKIKQVKIPYVNGKGSSGSVASGTNGLSTKVFLLSACELGGSNTYLQKDGVQLDYFPSTETYDPTRIAYLNGTASYWWLRSPSEQNTSYSFCVLTQGNITTIRCDHEHGIRPVMVIPFDTNFNPNTNIIM